MLEILVLVLAISVLALAAVPNFKEAETRAQIARIRSDQKILAAAIEGYYLDHGDYIPYCFWGPHGDPRYLNALSTPIAYLRSADAVADPYHDHEIEVLPGERGRRYGYWSSAPMAPPNPTWRQIVLVMIYYGYTDAEKYHYCFTSPGPDNICDTDDRVWNMHALVYDSSNGTVSQGDIGRFGP